MDCTFSHFENSLDFDLTLDASQMGRHSSLLDVRLLRSYRRSSSYLDCCRQEAAMKSRTPKFQSPVLRPLHGKKASDCPFPLDGTIGSFSAELRGKLTPLPNCSTPLEFGFGLLSSSFTGPEVEGVKAWSAAVVSSLPLDLKVEFSTNLYSAAFYLESTR